MEDNTVNETTLHCFDLENAEKYGILEAVILQHLQFWIQKNKACNRHFYDGRYWTYGSIKELHKLFWYVSEKQIRRAINNLKNKGAIITGEFNRSPYDHTTWYAISNSPNGNNDLPKRENQDDQMGNSTLETDIITDIRTDICNARTREKPPAKKIPPTLDMVKDYCKERDNSIDAEKFFDFYESKGWLVGKNKMKDWQAAVRTWERKDNNDGMGANAKYGEGTPTFTRTEKDYDEW